MARNGELTLKQQRFVEAYLVDGNATQAAIRAGYSRKTAKQIGSYLLTCIDVQQALREAQQRQQERAGIHSQEITRALARIGLADVNEPIKLAHKLKALELLLRHVSLAEIEQRLSVLERELMRSPRYGTSA
jgi:phage terminase small subunit